MVELSYRGNPFDSPEKEIKYLEKKLEEFKRLQSILFFYEAPKKSMQEADYEVFLITERINFLKNQKQ